MIDRKRAGIAGLAASLTLLGTVVTYEGYTTEAVIPTKNDRPTVGFGSTWRDDGSPVKMGDKITPAQAVNRTIREIQKTEVNIHKCVTAPLTQNEYDLMVDFAYQYGVGALCKSQMVKEANKGNYEESCKGYLNYHKAGGMDCASPAHKRDCGGVWTRSQDRYKKCIAGGEPNA